jgi:hypothetical protein
MGLRFHHALFYTANMRDPDDNKLTAVCKVKALASSLFCKRAALASENQCRKRLNATAPFSCEEKGKG